MLSVLSSLLCRRMRALQVYVPSSDDGSKLQNARNLSAYHVFSNTTIGCTLSAFSARLRVLSMDD